MLVVLLRLGRTNFQKCVGPTDPPAIQAVKQLISLRPMSVINKTNPGETLPLNNAVIVRRGRNTLTNVTKDHKEALESALTEFKNGLPSLTDERSALLVTRMLFGW